jgi:hypothetical protein
VSPSGGSELLEDPERAATGGEERVSYLPQAGRLGRHERPGVGGLAGVEREQVAESDHERTDVRIPRDRLRRRFAWFASSFPVQLCIGGSGGVSKLTLKSHRVHEGGVFPAITLG